MNHFKILFRYELLQHIHSMKFLTMGIFAVVFGFLSIYVQTMDYKARKNIYDEEIIKAQQTMSSATLYSQLNIPIIVPPNPLSIFAKGVDDKVGSKINISVLDVPQFENAAQKKNPFLDIFDSFDLSMLVHVLFSVMTLFLVADTIAGEREEGTLKQTFSNSVLKSQYFLAKYLGSLVILAIPLTIIYIIASLMILFDPIITLTAVNWLTVLMIYICSLVFVSIYILIGLCISARINTSSLASLSGLLVWIILVFIYPNATRYAVNTFVRIPSNDEVRAQITTLTGEIEEELESKLPKQEQRPVSYSWYSNGNYNMPTIISVTQKYNFEYNLACIQTGIPIVLTGQEGIYQAMREFKRQYAHQHKIASLLNRCLPGHLLTETASKMAGTHFQKRDLAIMNSARQYRSQILDYIRSKNGFGYAFFTQMPTHAMKDDWNQYPDDVSSLYSPNNYKKLSFDDMPVYHAQSRNIIPKNSIIDLCALIMINIVLFICGAFIFIRSDVRNKD
ncbi:ABC transporter permease subunit [bacterium]|nr:ABC transporter permease subunit [bacterium]